MTYLKAIKYFYRAMRKLVVKEAEAQMLRSRFPLVHFSDSIVLVGIESFFPGENTIIKDNVTINCGGQEWSKFRGSFRCGKNCFIGQNSVIYAAGDVEIGNDVMISPSVNIISHQHSFNDRSANYSEQEYLFSRVVLGNNIWIGTNVTILPGVKIGDNSVIGANALVNRDIPANSLAIGLPAKVIKEL